MALVGLLTRIPLFRLFSPKKTLLLSQRLFTSGGTDWKKALSILKEREQQPNGASISAYQTAIFACNKARQWRSSLELFRNMEQIGLHPNIKSFNNTISVCGKAKQWRKALGLFNSMESRGLEPDVITFNTMITAYAKGGQWEKALELFNSMESRGLEPNVITFSTMMTACEKGGQWEKAMELFNSARSAGCLCNVLSSNRQIDLHDCSVSVARIALAVFLNELRSGVRTPCDVTVITGRGNNSIGDAVLPSEMRSFFAEKFIDITEIPSNPGAFLLKKETLRGVI
jgi:pentatricopeptide repeat protein